MAPWHIGLIGFGEVGGIFGRALAAHPQVAGIHAWDLRFQRDPAFRQRVPAPIVAADSCDALCARATLVISAVTAANTLAVARQAALAIRPGAVFLDLNSASPGVKRQAAQAIEAAGAHYLEAGVMTSVPPYGIRVPMLIGGTQAGTMAPALAALGMDARPVSGRIGIASAIKMSRSILIKGLEALVIESYTNARRYGVEDHMLPTLAETFPGIDWPALGGYLFSRVAKHGQRRAEEMAEAARTVEETGIAPILARAIADKQQWVARLAADGAFEGLSEQDGWRAYSDRIIARTTEVPAPTPGHQDAQVN
ncbi:MULTISPECIES: NAD(P)-dependent oxidoreductase [Ralstonia solanacearum species complex]|uniref:6-phosphogluconate dehydrogenase protein n=2 Tax=Ralstonia solanacearum TaxID=305 RepID=A0A7U7JD26_RALSL|nr:NAD(P)-dependent oxidoreductase [Ralstonia solanacearum]ALF90926.1 NAD binding domain of 6-phosphogluconate dehydrogenase [Ralstonia solanacearum]ATI30346.1 6-phosphogluconate dehydrogenase [Ralstonia solanacearum]ATJ89085.1 6-phosphogluconate dehydrogenase [Ralstonia solanacearum]KEI30291.1 6-phosphogluconate dehydrogenase [Ralstonia solanacearum]KFX83119.1 6-phosphogluconate dehydrogenase [Ralstonia solanacearum]